MNIKGKKYFIEVCQGPSCGGKFNSEEIFNKLKDLASENEEVMIVKTGCLGHCDFSPNMKINGDIKTGNKMDELKDLYNSWN